MHPYGAEETEPPPSRLPGVEAMWGIHSDRPEVDFVDAGFVAIGWMAMPDLRGVGDDRDAMKAALAAAYPDASPRALSAWAGMLLRFAFEMRPGDLVVHPDKAERTVSVGRVDGDYRFEPRAPDLRHRYAAPPRRRTERGRREFSRFGTTG